MLFLSSCCCQIVVMVVAVVHLVVQVVAVVSSDVTDIVAIVNSCLRICCFNKIALTLYSWVRMFLPRCLTAISILIHFFFLLFSLNRDIKRSIIDLIDFCAIEKIIYPENNHGCCYS